MKVLCKKDVNYYEVYLYKDHLYEYKKDFGLCFKNDPSFPFIELKFLNIDDFRKVFYTVEETKSILRKRKIKSILNEK